VAVQRHRLSAITYTAVPERKMFHCEVMRVGNPSQTTPVLFAMSDCLHVFFFYATSRTSPLEGAPRGGDDPLINNAIVFILIFIHPILHHLVSAVHHLSTESKQRPNGPQRCCRCCCCCCKPGCLATIHLINNLRGIINSQSLPLFWGNGLCKGFNTMLQWRLYYIYSL